MGRGKVLVKKRIVEKKINRQVTFSKRRNGKAHELSLLIIFSDACSRQSIGTLQHKWRWRYSCFYGFGGNELDALNTNDLKHQLDMSLKRIRTTSVKWSR